ncbi:hypothetical protein ECE50_019155 [Chitinophaga sp. Mgbs1]|uniref:Uncharacterized protein n=1 Tax=Chitinophaga solisilvae TaxID=1233460 RepID=A0A9Q5D8T8_9BACT|nr:hypothetical protein [Chitinophaga solisilvae]
MNPKTSFKILNSSDTEMEIIHEPECFTFNLPINQEVLIETKAKLEAIQLRITIDEGKIVVSILDENSPYNVLHNGEDVFEKYI